LRCDGQVGVIALKATDERIGNGIGGLDGESWRRIEIFNCGLCD
jgi:hypothetical protein